MSSIDWLNVFDELHPKPGATDEEIEELLAGLRGGLTEDEIRQIRAEERSLDPSTWTLPSRPLPPAYLEFLRYSNGGSFRTGTRRFDIMLPTHEIRDTLLDLFLPESMPGGFPFASDHGGCLYAFDMREEPRDGEYPVLFCTLAAYDYDDALLAGNTFLEACSGHVDPPSL